jgi:hypothetical protein
MKNVLTAVVCAGFASAASAQSGSLTIVPSATFMDTHDGPTSYTLSVFGDADFGTAVAGGEFAINVVGMGVDGISDMVGSSAAWGALGEQDNGYSGNGVYDGLIFGQLIFPPFIPPADDSLLGAGPVLLGVITVSVEGFTCAVWEFNIVAGSGPFMLEIYDDADESFTQLDSSQLSLGSATITAIPSPSGMALVAMSGLVLARRRRDEM